MASNYFQQLKETTATRLWINNPTEAEIDLSIAHGAVSCTTNPTFSSNQLRRAPDYAIPVVDACIRESEDEDDSVVADLVQQRLAKRVMEGFLGVHEKSGRRDGWVSIQGDPHADNDAAHILDEARRYRELGPNFIAKIPATAAGLEAIETLIAEDMPIIVTEVFGLAQMIYSCELYQRVSRASGKTPAYYITHITGIYDEYLGDMVKRAGISIDPDVLAQAGLTVCREQYRLFKERDYPGIMLGGGARGIHHFTDLVGGEMHITVNWSTVEEILGLNLPLGDYMGVKTDPAVIEELVEKVPDFRRAYLADGLSLDEFASYGPVQHFRDQFIRGWDSLLETIGERRTVCQA